MRRLYNPVQVDTSKRYFTHEGEPFFYYADTAWSAMTHATSEEWEDYLRIRKSQGFTAVQINILHQHDAAIKDFTHPFAQNSDGAYLIDQPNKTYFDHALRIVRLTREYGLVPSLVLLWCNYVPGNWLGDKNPQKVIAEADIPGYIKKVTELFAPYAPIYMVAGDTDLETEDAIRYYSLASDVAREVDPEALQTLHLCGTYTDIPASLGEKMDFVMYQSGHGAGDSEKGYEMAEELLSWNKPLLNGEPNYEGFQRFGSHVRVSREDVRRVSWQSVTAGAFAGITYGAHGVWPWYSPDCELSGFYKTCKPFYWRECMSFEGADDVGFMRKIWHDWALFDLHPRQDLLSEDTPYIRVMSNASTKKIVVYVPFARDIRLKGIPKNIEFTALRLCDRQYETPSIEAEPDATLIRMGMKNSDYLILGKSIGFDR